METRPLIPRDCQRLLIVLPSWVGDTVMATPVLRLFRQQLPKATLIALVRPGLDALLAGNPWVDEVILSPQRGASGFVHSVRVTRSARAQAAILLQNSFRSAASLRLAGVPMRIGYARDGRGWLLTHSLGPSPQRPIPALDYYLSLAEHALGAAASDRRMELRTTAEEELLAGKVLEGVRRPFALLNPGGNKPEKRWPAERFARVADALHESQGLSAVVSGSPGERAVLDEVTAAARHPIVDLSRRGMTLGSLKAVLAQAALLVTNDTGPRHIAAALGTPIVTLFGPTDHRWTTISHPRERILLAEPFLPDNLTADDHQKLCSIDRIAAGEVVHAAQAVLGNCGRNSQAESS